MPDQRSDDFESRDRRKGRYRGISNDHAHPFLTPRGLELQRQQPRRSSFEQPIPLPAVSPGWAADAAALPATEADRIGQTPSAQLAPEELQQHLLQNIQPSKRFPETMQLRQRPLSGLFRSSLVSGSDLPKLNAIGKLRIQFSADPDKLAGVGSAWVAGPSLIVTAAHNVFDFNTQQWARQVTFQPGHDFYRQNATQNTDPKRSQQSTPATAQWFRISACAIPKTYLENPITNADVAYLYAENNVGDIIDSTIPLEPLADLDVFEKEAVDIVGYPAGSRFDFGKQLWRSRGAYLFGHRSGPGDPFAPVLATDFGGGSSGCPWIVIRDGKPSAIGLTSGHGKLGYAPDEPNLMSLTSPFLGEAELDSLFSNQAFHSFPG